MIPPSKFNDWLHCESAGRACPTAWLVFAPMPDVLIQGRSLEKTFGDLVAVDKIDFHVNEGESFGFLGPNGAGKTTTMRMIEAVSPITSGELTIDLNTWNVYWKGQRLMNPSNTRRPLAPTPRKLLRELVEVSPRPLTAGQVAERLNLDPGKFSYGSYRQHIKTLRRAFDAVESGFSETCNRGEGIVTFGDEGAYFWSPPGAKSA